MLLLLLLLLLSALSVFTASYKIQFYAVFRPISFLKQLI